MNAKADWGVPNWRHSEGYQVPPGLSPMLWWAWQFLRRNPEYRAYWQEYVLPDGTFMDGSWHVVTEIQNRFGLASPRSPSLPTGAEFFAAGLRVIGFTGAECVRLTRSDIGYIFDMTLPLGPQFERALTHAKEIQIDREQQGTQLSKTASSLFRSTKSPSTQPRHILSKGLSHA